MIKFSVGDLTSVGIYRGLSVCGCCHEFENISTGGITKIGVNSRQIFDNTPTLEILEKITQEEWDAKVAARNSLLEAHFANLPSYVMD